MKTILSISLAALAAFASAQQPQPGTAPAAPSKPEPIKPASVAPAAAPKTEEHTTVDSDTADMDLKNSVFTYINNVTVHSPQFHLTTDGTFTVYLKKEKAAKPADTPKAGEKGAAKAADGKAPPVTPADAAEKLSDAPGDTSTIDHAVAAGREVVITKRDADGKTKIGKCRNAYYDGATGDMILRDWPQVQDGGNIIVAIESTTVMTLTKDGKFKVKGRTRTDLAGGSSPAKGKGEVTPGAPPANGGSGINLPIPQPRRQQ